MSVPDPTTLAVTLDRLFDARRTAEHGELRSKLMRELDSLVPEHTGVLVELAAHYLERLRHADNEVARSNHGLHALFDFVESRRLREIRPVVEAALMNDRFRMKERYLQTLEELGDADSVPALLRLLSMHRGPSAESEDLRVAILNALIGYFPAPGDPSPVVQLLDDGSLRARTAALQFVAAHNVRSAAPALVSRVREERDPDLLAEVLGLIEAWRPPGAAAAIHERLTSSDDLDVKAATALTSALGTLREQG